MALVSGECPRCQTEFQVDDAERDFTCPSCGAKLEFDDAAPEPAGGTESAAHKEPEALGADTISPEAMRKRGPEWARWMNRRRKLAEEKWARLAAEAAQQREAEWQREYAASAPVREAQAALEQRIKDAAAARLFAERLIADRTLISPAMPETLLPLSSVDPPLDRADIEKRLGALLSALRLPECFPRSHAVEFDPDSGVLIVDFVLPAPEALPTIIEAEYYVNKEKHITATAHRQLYDKLLYSIPLRTVSELFTADVGNLLSAVVFNGYVRTIDKATGKSICPCVLSLHASREQFQEINLANVDPKTCFRHLKGVGSSKLHTLTPVAPIASRPAPDARFIQPREVVAAVQEGDNLASMDWDDFEHLVREIFEKEFAGNGGEVRVTRASRDGGIDAIAFDPDPIRGGKIAIQAKRYTNTVGVAAVRDLYGAVINEGAMKGILVTTSNYGPDAYEFANGKPISLLNGGHLLHLLEKHGHRARIDLQEAKRAASSESAPPTAT